eukprot:1182499-Amphidinium_carterae.1
MTLVGLQLAADGHHVDPNNKTTMGLLGDSPLDWKTFSPLLTACAGGTLNEHQMCICTRRFIRCRPLPSLPGSLELRHETT